MKKILSHFRVSLLLWLMLCANFTTSYTKSNIFDGRVANLLALTPNLANAATSGSETDPDVDSDVPDLPEPPTTDPVEDFTAKYDLVIRAFNPGYTVNGERDVGEFIELQKIADASPFSLAGYSLHYTNSSGGSTPLLDFSEGTMMVGESLLLRLAKSPGSDQSDATYMTTLAMSAGKLSLAYNGSTVDEVCWGKSGCYTAFKSAKPTTLVRDLTTGDFAHFEAYAPTYNPDSPSLILPEVPPDASEDPADDPTEGESPTLVSHCYGLVFSEILSYYDVDKSEQFIEFYNSTDHAIDLKGCRLRYKKKTYPLDGTLAAGKFQTLIPVQASPSFTLTKNPTTSNTLELLEADDMVIDVLVYNHGQKKHASYALFYDVRGEPIWQATYAPTPGLDNLYQEFQTCPSGKVINPATGNCVKASAAASTAECPAGKYRNPLTGRCKNLESESKEPKPCAEGYERNPTTNRCRKISGTNDGAGYALVPTTYTGKSHFVALGVVILIVSAGVLYVTLQFRREIARTARKVGQRLHHVRKDLVARGISFHRHKKP